MQPPYGLFQVELMPLILLLRKHLPGRSQLIYLTKGQSGTIGSQLLSQFIDLLLALQAGKCPDWSELLSPFVAILESSEVGGVLVEAILSSLLRILQHQSTLPPPSLLSKLLLTVTQCRFEASDFDRDELALSRLIDMIRWLVCDNEDLIPLFDDEALGRCLFTLFALLKQPRFSRVLRGHAELITLEVARTLFTAKEASDDDCELPLRPAKPVLTIPYPAGRSQETVVASAELMTAEEEEALEEMPRYRLSSHSQASMIKYLLALIDPLDPRTDEQSAAIALHCLRHAGGEMPLLAPLMTALSTEGGRMSLPVGYCLDSLLPGSLRQCDQALTRILALMEKCEGFALQPKLRTQLEMLLPLLASLLRGRTVDLWLRVECSLEYQTMNLSRLSQMLTRLDSSPSQIAMLVRAMLVGILKEMSDGLRHHCRTSLEGRRLKGRLVEAAVLFGESPKQALSLLQQQGLLQDATDHGQVASLLHRMHGLLDRKALGEFLAKPGNEGLLYIFLSRFNLRGLRLDQALRTCMHAFRLPGEAQQISRVMEQLASVYFEQQDGDDAVIKDCDSAYILAYSIVMLNTDQHNKQVKKQLSFFRSAIA